MTMPLFNVGIWSFCFVGTTSNAPHDSDTRHSCEQNDKLDTYTWTEYDARQGGVQVIKDNPNNVKITTEFLNIAGGDHGGSWAVRIKGEPIDPGTESFSFAWTCPS